MILGIDEVGRGPWAGPLVIGAVVLGGTPIDGLTDSKKLTKKRREQLDIIIREQAAGYGLGWVYADEIDEIGLSEALRLATKRAVEQIKTPYHEIIIDGTINFLAGTNKGDYVTTMAKADLLVPSVSAASIIAKVARDNYMAEQDKLYDGYNFASHVGYGTAVHRAAIEKNGVTPLHRLSFAPLAKYRKPARHPELDSGSNRNKSKLTGFRIKSGMTAPVVESGTIEPTTKKIGDLAEDEVANYLVRHGHEIIERNWKTKYCEIDIVSQKDGTVYFTEVKYRKRSDQGGGFAAITTKKLNQMKFAAKFYAQANNLNDSDLLLAAASVTGELAAIEEWLILD
jgi:ribonuclease HII